MGLFLKPVAEFAGYTFRALQVATTTRPRGYNEGYPNPSSIPPCLRVLRVLRVSYQHHLSF